MEKQIVEQLWYTWSGTGIRQIGLGMQIRAASMQLLNQSEAFYRFVEECANYILPDGIDSYTDNSPICLAFLASPYGKLLLHKVYLGSEAFGRSGNFFTHLLIDFPEDFTPYKAIQLWEAPFWQTRDLEEEEQSTCLPPLVLDEAQPKRPFFKFDGLEKAFVALITLFLTAGTEHPRVSIRGNSQQIATLIWGLTRSLPATLLPADFSFTTYASRPSASHEHIVGITTARELYASYSSKPIVKPLFTSQSNGELAEDITEYASFAVQCLKEMPDGQYLKLMDLVAQAEEIEQIEDFLQLFRERLLAWADPIEEELISSIQTLPEGPSAISQEESVTLANAAPAPLLFLSLPPVKRNVQAFSSVERRVRTALESILFSCIDLKKRLVRYAQKNALLLLVLIGLLLFSNLLTHFASATPVNQLAIRSTALAQAQVTISARATFTAQTSNTTDSGTPGNHASVLAYSLQQNVTIGTRFFIYVTYKNTGTTTWSDADGYKLVCVPQNDDDCQKSASVGFLDAKVTTGSTYKLIMQLMARNANPHLRKVELSLSKNGQTFGQPQTVFFYVQ